MKQLEKHPMIMIVVGILGVSFSAIFVRLSRAPSAVTAACRLLWTVALMSPAILGRGASRRELLGLGRRALVMSAASGLLLAVHFLCWFEALYRTRVANASILVSTEVIWVALGYCLFLKGKLSHRAVLAIAVTLGGSAMIACSDVSGGDSLQGDLLALVAAVAAAGYTLLGRQVRRQVSTGVYTYVVYLSCCCALLALVAVKGYPLLGYGGTGVVSGLLLAVFSTLLGHSVFSWCLKFFSPTFVSASKLCEPVFSSVAAGLLFQEIPTAMQLLGGGVVLAGVVWYSLIESRSGG